MAGKTGTVNNHTDVWFIGYTPTYVTGVWMGNPLRKESLGRGMTGGGTALPIFNSFMNPFMKDKPRDSFPSAPPMPGDIKALMERNKREEREKLAKADLLAAKTGAASETKTDERVVNGENPGGTSPPTSTDTRTDLQRPNPTGNDPVIIKVPPVTQQKRDPDPPPPAPEGTKRKGKKGDG